MSQDQQAQNFVLDMHGSQVNIYPSQKTGVFGFKDRFYKPYASSESVLDNVILFFQSILRPSLSATLYSVSSMSVKISDELDICGVLRLDKESNVYFMDQPLAFLKDEVGNGLEDLKTSLFLG